MSIALRRDPRTVIPDFLDWFEEPFLTLGPYLGQPIRIEDYTEDGHYVVRAEIAGIDPEKDLEVSVGADYLSIHAERSSQVESKHRSEFRYGSFSRTLPLPSGADIDDVTAEYANGSGRRSKAGMLSRIGSGSGGRGSPGDEAAG